jgi:cell division protein FtsI/penicillin-binding protein 2
MNRALFRLSLACLVMFVLLLVNINYVQGFEASSLASKPGNARTFDQQFQYQRGSIIADGTGGPLTIADSQPVKGDSSSSGNAIYQRHYPHGAMYAPITGYDTVYGATGIESAYNKYLAGTSPSLAVHNLISLLTGKAKQGASVNLTVSPKAQKAAYQALLRWWPPGRRRRAQPEHRRHPGHGLLPFVQPEPAHHVRRCEAEQDRQAAAGGPVTAAAQPGHQPDLPARFLVQDHH